MSKKLFIHIKDVVAVFPKHIVKRTNQLFSLLVLATAVGIMVFAGYKIYISFTSGSGNILYSVMLLFVFLKVFQMLLHYYSRQYVSIKQIMEVAILMLIICVTFSPETRGLWLNISLGVFALGNLVTYLIFYDKLVKIEGK